MTGPIRKKHPIKKKDNRPSINKKKIVVTPYVSQNDEKVEPQKLNSTDIKFVFAYIICAGILITCIVLLLTGFQGVDSRGDPYICFGAIVIIPIILAIIFIFIKLLHDYNATKEQWQRIKNRRGDVIRILGLIIIFSGAFSWLGYPFIIFIVAIVWLGVYLLIYRLCSAKHEIQ
jgi:O-antigen/teichoic acid export membrane protein